MQPNVFATAFLAVLLLMPQVLAAEISILSAGAIEAGVVATTKAFQISTGSSATIRFATAPAILKSVMEGQSADVVIAPATVLDTLIKAGKLTPRPHTPVGKVGTGIAVRSGALAPDIATTDALRRSVLAAQSIVYNEGSSGVFIDGLIKKLGIADAIAARVKRYPDARSVMQHVSGGTGTELGFGALTAILLFKDKGVTLAGPLPPEVQNHTSYAAAAHSAGANAAGAVAFLQFLQKPEARRHFASHGVD